jgi:predicted lipoprotein with Yx(FWY)xxD motif
MFPIRAARTNPREAPMRLLSVVGAPLALAVVIAGCGSSSSSTATKASANAGTSSTTTMMHETKKPASGESMAMSHGGHTAASMLGMKVANAEVTVGGSPHYGNVLYDKDHFALYAFSADHGSTSTCYGACEKAWPPMLTTGRPRVAGVNPSLLGTTKRRDGSLQVTFGGHPLYYWSGDEAHTIMCQHVKLHGGLWYVVRPDGTPNTAKGIGTMSAMSS